MEVYWSTLLEIVTSSMKRKPDQGRPVFEGLKNTIG